MELAYLHPAFFKPKINVFKLLKIKETSPYVIVRFVSWKAIHDIGKKGLSDEQKIQIVNELSTHAKVFISSEIEIPAELKQYEINIEPHLMHDVIANASLMYSESSTMAAEAAVLSIPSIYVSPSKRGYVDELANKYNLIVPFNNTQDETKKSLHKSIELIKQPNIQQEWQQKRQKMLSEKINASAFLIWFIENYPQSAEVMKENPDYQYYFK